MRRAAGWALLVVGVVLVFVGAAATVLFGPDNQISTGPHELSSDGVAVVTAPAVLGYAGPTVEVVVDTVGAEHLIFVGLANDIDVRDYLAGVPITRVDDVSLPWDVASTDVTGDGPPAVPPQGLDWWLVSDQGRGSARIAFRLPDATVDIVASAPDRQPGLRIAVTATLLQEGAFVGGLAVVASGLGLVTAGWVLTTRSRSRQAVDRRRGRSGDDLTAEPPRAPQPVAEPEPVGEPEPEPQR